MPSRAFRRRIRRPGHYSRVPLLARPAVYRFVTAAWLGSSIASPQNQDTARQEPRPPKGKCPLANRQPSCRVVLRYLPTIKPRFRNPSSLSA